MKVHVFDAFGTLFDVQGAVNERAEALGGTASRLAEKWRSKQLEYTWVVNSLGAYESFDTLTERALDFAIADCGLTPLVRDDLLAAYRHLRVFPEVAGALSTVRDRGDMLLILTNAGEATTRALLDTNGIEDLFTQVVSVDLVRRFKPDSVTYGLLDHWRKRAPLTFYSANRWDIAGASAVGLDTVWVNRRDAPNEYPGTPPRRSASDLIDALIDGDRFLDGEEPIEELG